MNLALYQLFLCCGWHLFFLSLSCVYFFLKTSKSSQVKLSERAQKIPLAKKYQPKGSFLNIPSKTSFESKKAYTQKQLMQREVHLTGKNLMEMVQLRPQDIGKYAIVPGPKERLDSLLKKIENPVKNFSFMEYNMYTGNFAGTKVTAINGGRFSADTAITTELLCNAEAQYMIRIGSCGSLSPDIKVGDLIVIEIGRAHV